MIRTIVKVDKKDMILNLPEDFLGKQVEIIAFVLENGMDNAAAGSKSKTYQTVQLDTRNYKFDREEANRR